MARQVGWMRGWAIELISLSVILAVSAVLRFQSLTQRGFVYWDEGKFALEGVRLEAAAHSLFFGGAIMVGKAVGTAKPTHALLIALAYGIFGVHDYAALFLNAVCSVLASFLIYLITRELFGSPAALVAAAFLAVSEYDAIYARSALSESDANLLFLTGVLIWVMRYSRGGRERRMKPGRPPHTLGVYSRMRSPEGWGLGLAGLFMGLAFTTNYRLIVYIAAIVGFDLLWILLGTRWTVVVRRILPWALGLVMAPLLWEVVDVITRSQGLVLFRSEQTGAPRAYVSQVLYQLHQGRQSRVNFNPGLYLHWYALRSGWPMFVLLLGGLAIAIWRGVGQGRPSHIDGRLSYIRDIASFTERRPSFIRSGVDHGGPSYMERGAEYVSAEQGREGARARDFRWWAMLVPVIIPYVIYVFAPFIVARNLDAALPFAAALSAVALVECVDWMWLRIPSLTRVGPSARGGRIVTSRSGALLILLIVGIGVGVLGGRMSWRLGAERSGYARAASFVERFGHGKGLVSSEILVFYLRGSGAQCTGNRMPGTLARLVTDVRSGYQYAALDHASGTIAVLVRKWMHPLVRYTAVDKLSVGENVLESEVYPQSRRPLQAITVYRILKGRLPSVAGKPDVCNRERV